MDKIGIFFIAPKKIADVEKQKVVREIEHAIKLVGYYEDLDNLKKVEALFCYAIGGNFTALNACKSMGLTTKYLAHSITNTDVSFADFSSFLYKKKYVFVLWDGKDDVVRKQMESASKFGFSVKLRMIKPWEFGEKTFA